MTVFRFVSCAANLRNRRGAAERASAAAQQAAGNAKENLHPGKVQQDACVKRVSKPDDADVLAMWERSVRDVFAALADEEGSSTFGFSVSTAKNPRDGELPTIAIPPEQDGNGSADIKMSGDVETRLMAVNGQLVAGHSAQEIKDMVASGWLLLRLDVVVAKNSRDGEQPTLAQPPTRTKPPRAEHRYRTPGYRTPYGPVQAPHLRWTVVYGAVHRGIDADGACTGPYTPYGPVQAPHSRRTVVYGAVHWGIPGNLTDDHMKGSAAGSTVLK